MYAPSGAVVGLEETFYRVSEDVGVVVVCAIVYSPDIECPIQFPFNVSLSTTGNNDEGVSTLIHHAVWCASLFHREYIRGTRDWQW